MRSKNKTTRPMFEPRVENGYFVIRFHDGLYAQFPLPDKQDKDGIRAALQVMRVWARFCGASIGQSGVDDVGNGGTIIKAFRKAGYYLTCPRYINPVKKLKRVVLTSGVELRV